MNLPVDLEAEEACVAASLVNRDAATTCVEIVAPSDFWNEQLGWAFAAIVTIVKQGSHPDSRSVAHLLAQQEKMDQLDARVLFERIISALITPFGVAFYANIVKAKALARRLDQAAATLHHEVAKDDADIEQVIAQHEATISQIRASTGYDDASTDAETVGDALEAGLEAWMADPRAIRGMSTGWPRIDQQVDGFKRQSFVLIAAATSIGKSLLVHNLLRNISRPPRFEPTLLFTTEMSVETVQRRLIFMEAGIDPYEIRQHGTASNAEKAMIREAWALVRTWPIRYVYRGKPTPSSIQAEVRRDRARRGTEIAFVDHIGHVQAPGRDTKERTSNAARGLKAITMDEDICLVATAHVNRDGANSGAHLRLSNLADSSDLEKEADDVGLFTPVDAGGKPMDDMAYRKLMADQGWGYVEADWAKVRSGSTGAVPMLVNWWEGGGRFVETSRARGGL